MDCRGKTSAGMIIPVRFEFNVRRLGDDRYSREALLCKVFLYEHYLTRSLMQVRLAIGNFSKNINFLSFFYTLSADTEKLFAYRSVSKSYLSM